MSRNIVLTIVLFFPPPAHFFESLELFALYSSFALFIDNWTGFIPQSFFSAPLGMSEDRNSYSSTIGGGLLVSPGKLVLRNTYRHHHHHRSLLPFHDSPVDSNQTKLCQPTEFHFLDIKIPPPPRPKKPSTVKIRICTRPHDTLIIHTAHTRLTPEARGIHIDIFACTHYPKMLQQKPTPAVMDSHGNKRVQGYGVEQGF